MRTKDKLNDRMPASVKRLAEQGKKEQRLKKRADWWTANKARVTSQVR